MTGASGLAYATWMSQHVPADAEGLCREVAEEMAGEFVDLSVVYGIYREPSGGVHWHFWCEDLEGNVVDPTASQFEEGGVYQVGEIEGVEVTGLCRLCSRPVFDGDEECPLGCEANKHPRPGVETHA